MRLHVRNHVYEICISAVLLSLGLSSVAAVAQPALTLAKKRAAMEPVQIPSHGVLMNGIVYVAEGEGPHPVVILLHGFPGNEQNLDLAQDIRRAGWNVLFFHYRGSWGSPGDYSFSHDIEDVASATAYIRDPAVAKKLRADASRIVLVGHSVGGFSAVLAAAADPSISAVALISAADIAGTLPEHLSKSAEGTARNKLVDALGSQGMAPLNGATPDGLAQDVLVHAARWRFTANATALASRPLLDITADDGFSDGDDALADAVKKAGNANVTIQHFATDHSYSDQRVELSASLVAWLKALPVKQEADVH